MTAALVAPQAFATDECGPNAPNATITCTAGAYPEVTYQHTGDFALNLNTGVNVTTGGVSVTAVNSLDGRNITITGPDATITSSVQQDHGVTATTVLGIVNISTGTVSATGGGADGIHAEGSGVQISAGTTSASGPRVVVAGQAAVISGINAAGFGNGVQVVAQQTTVANGAGDMAYGIRASNVHGNVTVDSGNVSVTGFAGGAGVYASSQFGSTMVTVGDLVQTNQLMGVRQEALNGSNSLFVLDGAHISGGIYGAYLAGGGSGANTVFNFGRIEAGAGFFGNGLIALAMVGMGPNETDAPDAVLNNGGQIIANGGGGIAVQFGDGNDQMNILPGSQIVGQIRGGAGTDTMNLTGNVNTSNGAQVVANVVEFEQLNVNSGFWRTTGATSFSNVNVGTGTTLQVETAISGLTGIVNNGQLIYRATQTGGVLTAPISGNGKVIFAGPVGFLLNGNHTYTGGTRIDADGLVIGGSIAGDVELAANTALIIGNGGTTGSVGGNVLLVPNSSVVFNRSNDYAFAGDIIGGGVIVKQGAGAVQIGDLDDFTGAISVTGGTLRIGRLDYEGNLALNGALTLATGAHSVGSVTSNTSSTSINLENAALTFNPTGTSTYGGSFTGTGSLLKEGTGTLVLTGVSTFSGPFTVQGGTLRNNGTLAGPVNVFSGATLSGGGNINGNVTIGAGGTLNPGSTVGTLTVGGNVTLATGSTYVTDISGINSGDRLNATGTVTIQPGTTLSLNETGLNESYGRIQRYNLIVANGGVTGQFANVTSSLAFLTPHLIYSGNMVQVDLLRNDITFESLGVTPNQKLVGRAIEAGGYGSPLFDALIVKDAAGSRVAYDALSGEAYNSFGAALVDLTQSVHAARPIAPAQFESGFSAWTEAVIGSADGESLDVANVTTDRSGVLFGGDLALDGVHAGGSFGFIASTMEVVDRASQADATSFLAEGHAGFAFGQFSIEAGAEFGNHTVEAARSIVFPGLSDATTGAFDATTVGANLEIAAMLSRPFDSKNPSAFLQPFASVSWERLSMGSFEETGGDAALGVEQKDQDYLFTRFGARGMLALNGFTIAGSVAQRLLNGGTESLTDMTFDTGATFSVAGVPVEETATELNIDLSMAIGGGGLASLSWSGVMGEAWNSSLLNASAKWTF